MELEGKTTSKRKKEKKKSKSKFGSLFKSSVATKSSSQKDDYGSEKQTMDEHSKEYWNEQRAKLGLKPLNKK